MAIAASSTHGGHPASPLLTIAARHIVGRPLCCWSDYVLDSHTRRRYLFTGLAKSTRDQEGMLQAAVHAGVCDGLIQDIDTTSVEIKVSKAEAILLDGAVDGFYTWFSQAMSDAAATLYCYETSEHCKVVTLKLPTKVVQRAFTTTLRACQERTAESDAATSVVSATRIEAERWLLDHVGKCSTPVAMITLSAWFANMVASNRAHIHTHDTKYFEMSDEPNEVYNVAGDVISTRMPKLSTPEEQPLRPSVVVTGLDAREVEREEQARNRNVDESTMSTDRIIGPQIFASATPSIDANTLEAELSGVQRHLNQKKKLEYRPENLSYLERGEKFMTAKLVAAFAEAFPADSTLPASWSEQLRDVVTASFGEQRHARLQGFVKPREVGLPEDKYARLIGTEGPEVSGDRSVFVSPIEKAWKEQFPGAVTKGLTNDEVDGLFRQRLSKAKADKRRVCSCDFSALDSTWQLHEKRAILRMLKACVEAMLGGPMAEDFDRVMAANDVRCSQKKIAWKLKYVNIIMSDLEALLFSGERITSLGNRWLVLLLRTSELLRLKGVDAAETYWLSLSGKSDEAFDVGDGDDTAFLMMDEYADEAAVIQAYKGYAKHIEPVISKDSIEVLSRFTIESKGQHVHLAKLARNAGRMVYQSMNKAAVGTSHVFTSGERAEIATALLFRAYAMRQTLVLRKYALALARYHMVGCENEAPSVVDRRGARGDQFASDTVARYSTLTEFYESVVDAVASSHTSGYAMVRLVYHGKSLPDAKTIKKQAWAWYASDDRLDGFEICDDDFHSPQGLIDRMALEPEIVAALEIDVRHADRLVESATPERGDLLCPQHAPTRHLEPPPGLMASDNAVNPSDDGGAQRKHLTGTQPGRLHSDRAKPPQPMRNGRGTRGGAQRNPGGNRYKTNVMATDPPGTAGRPIAVGVGNPTGPR